MQIYMIGIGGIGMSALAQLYAVHGEEVSGSDRSEGPTIDLLRRKGIPVIIGQTADNVPKDTDVVVYSDAVPFDADERVRARELGIPERSYFQALGEVSAGVTTIAVAGTHGKTTTTAMLTKILVDAGHNPTAIIGSLVKDFDSNFVEGSPDLFVVEACEYKDHVLEIDPKILVITNVEWDHTDYFLTEADFIRTFNEAARKVPAGGAIVTNPALPHMQEVLQGVVAPVIDYTKEEVPELALIGDFNVQNAKAAKAAALVLASDLTDSQVAKSLKEFRGTWRRFEYKGETKEHAFVFDDYAHHPTAILKTLAAARTQALIGDAPLIVVFQPHLYTRTRDLMEGFASAFSEADEVVLAPIYAAREDPIPGVTSEELAKLITAHGTPAKAFPSLSEIETYLETVSNFRTRIITMGAGDVYTIAEHLTDPSKFEKNV
jgi:UDP-N-acetylmuramate--alanine ligase